MARDLDPLPPIGRHRRDHQAASLPAPMGYPVVVVARDGAPRSRPRVPGDVLVHLRRARDHIDRHYADPLDLDTMAGVAALSKYHFHRLFTATYGVTPAGYLSQRRVERAQDLLRATNLTVTEVCYAVGFTSLGSFSTRFREIVGESPREFARRWGGQGPRIPGCFVLMWGLAERRVGDVSRAAGSASQEKPGRPETA